MVSNDESTRFDWLCKVHFLLGPDMDIREYKILISDQTQIKFLHFSINKKK